MRVKSALSTRLAAALVALALAVLGLGHTQAPAPPQHPLVAAWLQSGGSLEDLCLTDSGRSDHGQHPDCPVCALGKSMALADSDLPPRADSRRAALHLPPGTAHLADAQAPRAPPARGPPVALA